MYLKNNLYVPIMTENEWDSGSEKLLIAPEIYNEEVKPWAMNVEETLKPKLNLLEIVEDLEG